jgi:hypothetical protein
MPTRANGVRARQLAHVRGIGRRCLNPLLHVAGHKKLSWADTSILPSGFPDKPRQQLCPSMRLSKHYATSFPRTGQAAVLEKFHSEVLPLQDKDI